MGQSSIVHNFDESLNRSLEMSEEMSWVKFYKRLWPDALSIVRADKKSMVQTRGIDRMIWLPSGKQLLFDEKCRSKWYGDILLEVTSIGHFRDGEYVPKSAGWALDDTKYCDFVSYAIPSVKRCYLLPFELTKAALNANFSAWKKVPNKFPKYARNKGYHTCNIGVSWNDLKAGICQQMSRQFDDFSEELPKGVVVGNQLEFDW